MNISMETARRERLPQENAGAEDVDPVVGGPAAELLRLMSQDKKVRSGKLTFILVRGIGEAFITRDVAMDRLAAFMEREVAR